MLLNLLEIFRRKQGRTCSLFSSHFSVFWAKDTRPTKPGRPQKTPSLYVGINFTLYSLLLRLFEWHLQRVPNQSSEGVSHLQKRPLGVPVRHSEAEVCLLALRTVSMNFSYSVMFSCCWGDKRWQDAPQRSLTWIQSWKCLRDSDDDLYFLDFLFWWKHVYPAWFTQHVHTTQLALWWVKTSCRDFKSEYDLSVVWLCAGCGCFKNRIVVALIQAVKDFKIRLTVWRAAVSERCLL